MHSSQIIFSLGLICFCSNIFVSSQPVESENSFYWLTHTDPSQKVVGGSSCSPPHQVSLQSSRGSHFCGGSIMSGKCIVRAIVFRAPPSIKVSCGAHSLYSSDMTTYGVSQIKVHPEYDSSTVSNDIAILKLSSSIPLGANASVNKVDMPQSGEEYSSGTDVLTSGYGTTSESGSSSSQCMCVTVPIVSNFDCNKAYSNKIKDSMVCAGTKGKDSCQGDSGGPLMYGNTLIGIVSWGKGCAREGYPGVYTRVVPFLSWIAEVAKDMDC